MPNHKREGGGGPNYANSHVMAQAVMILNMLVGAVDRESGEATMFFGWKPSSSLQFVQNSEKKLRDLIFEKGSIDGKHEFPLVTKLITVRGLMTHAVDRIMAKDPFPLKMAIFRRYGIQSFPQQDKVAEALKTLDYVVFCDTIKKDIIQFADMILPESTFLEKTFIPDRSLPIPGKKVIVTGNAAQKAAGESKGWTGVLIDIGKKLDEKRGTKYFWIKDGDAERPVTSTDENNSTMASVGMTFDDLKNAKDGVIVIDAPYKSRSEYSTPSKKLEIYSNMFAENGYDPLPGWVEKATQLSEKYPFYFMIRRHPAMKHSAPLSSNNAHVLDAFPENYAWINAKAAARLGINDGDRVEVESPAGKVRINAKVTQRIREDAIITEHNFGHRIKELEFAGRGPSTGDLIPLRPEKPLHGKEWSGNAYMQDVCVNVRKV